ncbi:HypC/HybG/HupF family hydrogenase formation chaperone [Nitriliruptor alkaliphilus]|uniref:HypC/HybG/HupF family hydrogenase formation chaperone n=1 Tax=Nitriliruptor alkaliphilus TaxID=427918 RepID=UPI0006982296|nr:HypC/HybG/HupF family hydrogenase formation chaperone [Nitriliruptor alkaliphilus]
MCLGVPGKVLEIRDERGTRMATVDFGGVTKDVCLAYVPEAEVGQYTLIHAGFAITMVDEASALQTLALFEELGVLAEELGPEPDVTGDRAPTGGPSREGTA